LLKVRAIFSGAIDNSDLLLKPGGGDDLRQGLRKGKDFFLVPVEAWDRFYKTQFWPKLFLAKFSSSNF
jgi:hypothetical protein